MAAGGATAPLTKLDIAHQEDAHYWPCFLPDGRHFLYFVNRVSTEQDGVYLGLLDGKENRRLLADESNAIFAAGT